MKVLVKFDYIPLVRDVTDEEVENHSKKFIERLNRTVKPRSSILKEEFKERKEKRALSKEAETWLRHMARNPYLTIVDRTKALGITNYMANKVIKELEVKGYARKLNVYTGKPGHPLVLTDYLEKGIECINTLGEKIYRTGKSGLVHQWWAMKIKEFWKARGKEVKIEPNVEGANTDVLIMDSDGKRVAVEIALSSDHQVENIIRCLRYFDAVVLATETKILMMKIRAEAVKSLSKDDLERVTFCLLGDFLP
jgi:DNA-binding MarR family transcriptional regulator